MIIDPKVGDRVIRRLLPGISAVNVADNERATIVKVDQVCMHIQWDQPRPFFSTVWSIHNPNFFPLHFESQLNDQLRREEHANKYL